MPFFHFLKRGHLILVAIGGTWMVDAVLACVVLDSGGLKNKLQYLMLTLICKLTCCLGPLGGGKGTVVVNVLLIIHL